MSLTIPADAHRTDGVPCGTCKGRGKIAVWDSTPRPQGRRVSEPWLDLCPDCNGEPVSYWWVVDAVAELHPQSPPCGPGYPRCKGVPPADLLALTEPCDTCDGQKRCEAETVRGAGGAYSFNQCERWATTVRLGRPCCTQHAKAKSTQWVQPERSDPPLWRCPNCVDGRQLVEARQACQNPGCHLGHEMDPTTSEPVSLGRCRDYCDEDDGTVPLGVGTLTLLPVVEYGKHSIVGDYVVIGPDTGTAFAMHNGERFPPVELIELPFKVEPGQYVARFEVTA